MSKLIFINYRRDDSTPSARLLRETMVNLFGEEAVFMDVNNVRVGDSWASVLDEKLSAASVLLVVIGPQWLRAQDEYFRRRLDQPDDWVCKEIARALTRGIEVIALLVDGATKPPKEALPDAIHGLFDRQFITLHEIDWDHSLRPLFDRLTRKPLEFAAGERVPVPWPAGTGPDYVPRELPPEEKRQELSALPQWREVTSPLPGELGKLRSEITRRFSFASFEQAIAFMEKAVPHISEIQHHPRWENVFKTVTVWLSTWDGGWYISKPDCELARYLDDLFDRGKGPEDSPPN